MEMQNPTPAPPTPGRGMLKVTGILYIVFGGITMLLALFALLGTIAMPEYMEYVAGISADFLAVMAMVLFIQSGFSLFVGIVAVRNCADAEKATFIRAIVIIHLVMLVLQIIVDISIGSIPIEAIAGVTVPIVALVGAQKNVNALQ